jgi:hypothetical protein
MVNILQNYLQNSSRLHKLIKLINQQHL